VLAAAALVIGASRVRSPIRHMRGIDHLITPARTSMIEPANTERLCGEASGPALRRLLYEAEHTAPLHCFARGGCAGIAPIVPGDAYVFAAHGQPVLSAAVASTDDGAAAIYEATPETIVTRRHYSLGESVLLEPLERGMSQWTNELGWCKRPVGPLVEGAAYAWVSDPERDRPYDPLIVVTATRADHEPPPPPRLVPVSVELADCHFICPPQLVESRAFAPASKGGGDGERDVWYRATQYETNGSAVYGPYTGPIVLVDPGAGVRAGEYRFAIEAVDAAGNRSEPATYHASVVRPSWWAVLSASCCAFPCAFLLVLVWVWGALTRAWRGPLVVALVAGAVTAAIGFELDSPAALLALGGVTLGVLLNVRARLVAHRLREWNGRASARWVLVPGWMLGHSHVGSHYALARVREDGLLASYRIAPEASVEIGPFAGTADAIREAVLRRMSRHAIHIVFATTLLSLFGNTVPLEP
jgi:hypothetical protein